MIKRIVITEKYVHSGQIMWLMYICDKFDSQAQRYVEKVFTCYGITTKRLIILILIIIILAIVVVTLSVIVVVVVVSSSSSLSP